MKLRHKIILLYLACIALAFAMKGCEAEEVDVNIVIQIESGGNPNAYNKKSGAIGLMQITPIVLREFKSSPLIKDLPDKILVEILFSNVGDLFNPHFNIQVGAWYVNIRIPQMLETYKISDTIDNRLIAYNWGIGNLKKWYQSNQNFNKLPEETRSYLWRYHKLTEEK